MPRLSFTAGAFCGGAMMPELELAELDLETFDGRFLALLRLCAVLRWPGQTLEDRAARWAFLASRERIALDLDKALIADHIPTRIMGQLPGPLGFIRWLSREAESLEVRRSYILHGGEMSELEAPAASCNDPMLDNATRVFAVGEITKTLASMVCHRETLPKRRSGQTGPKPAPKWRKAEWLFEHARETKDTPRVSARGARQQFRGVEHICAALWNLRLIHLQWLVSADNRDEAEQLSDAVFTYSCLQELPWLLRVASRYLAILSDKSLKKPLIDPETAWKVPRRLNLEPLDFVPERLPPDWIAKLSEYRRKSKEDNRLGRRRPK